MGTNTAGVNFSRGTAVVNYATRDEAAEAMKRLYFEDELGQFIQVDFYKSKENRM